MRSIKHLYLLVVLEKHMNLSNKLTKLLDVDYPIVQAPMGGESTPEMAIAVSNAGGLGGLGCSSMSLQDIEKSVKKIRAGTNRSFNLNFFTHPEPHENPDTNAKTRARLEPFYNELGITDIPTHGKDPYGTFTEEKLNLMLDLRPKVVSFHFGLPADGMVQTLQEAGIIIMCSATTVEEAVWLDEAGVDVIIAQGWEAGGHRGTFCVSHEDFGVGTLALVPQMVDAVNKPVIASGGIADGRGIAATFILGAMGVQLGTAFLSCPEANISDSWREALSNASDADTRLTSAFSGRPARAKNNRYIATMSQVRSDFPDFPTMYDFSGPLEQACLDGNANGLEFFLYGQAASLNRLLPAADLVQLLVEETRNALNSRFE
jgi:nitronate monooxygenase